MEGELTRPKQKKFRYGSAPQDEGSVGTGGQGRDFWVTGVTGIGASSTMCPEPQEAVWLGQGSREQGLR